MQRAQREQGWALDTQTWTTTKFGLEPEEDSNVPQTGWGMDSPIQCLLCATFRIPALRFCYQCFNNVAGNHIIRVTNAGGSHRYRCHMCFIETKTRAVMYQHCSQTQIPKEYVDFRYPFKEHEIAIITSGEQCPGREPQGSWATQPREDPDQQGGGARGREGVLTEDPHLPERVTKGRQLQGLTSSPAGPQRTLVHVVGITLLPTPQRRTTRPWKGRGTGVPDRHLPAARQEIPSPKPHAPVGPGSWRVADGR